MNWTEQISVVIPVGKKEASWKSLLESLRLNENKFEVILSSVEPLKIPSRFEPLVAVKMVSGSEGRAVQLNRGASLASRKYLWFLHADSRFTQDTLVALKRNIEIGFEGIRYFDLGFFDGPLWMLVNELGTKVRSRILHLPFGDQGFCMLNHLFVRLGRFDESAPFGEDHLLIWKAHEEGVSVKSMDAKILTSGRKYQKRGWLKTTTQHLKLTYLQAKSEILRIRAKKQEIAK